MYRDLDHLRELCQYYLKNDEERKRVVALCNQKIQKGFSFDDRVEDLFEILKMRKPKPSDQPQIIYVATPQFEYLGRRLVRGLFRRWTDILIRVRLKLIILKQKRRHVSVCACLIN